MLETVRAYTPEILVVLLVIYLIWQSQRPLKPPKLHIYYTKAGRVYALNFRTQPLVRLDEQGDFCIYLDVNDIKSHSDHILDWEDFWDEHAPSHKPKHNPQYIPQEYEDYAEINPSDSRL